jgi:hypothetical protein
MRYAGMTVKAGGMQLRQVQRRRALKLWTSGRSVYMLASNMRPDNIWEGPCLMPAWDGETDGKTAFTRMVYDFMYCNCDAERGRYVQFFTGTDWSQ